ncbi:Aminomethyltransferase folate-binding domain-containing protein [Amylocystis lapponica]|nr:Aminomethyltransferase folate-binding domain-containing protein [Amylocystis lapponica]
MLPPIVRTLVRNVPTVSKIPNRSVLSVTGSQTAEFLNGVIASSIPEDTRSHFFSAFLHAQASGMDLQCCYRPGRVLYDVFAYAHPSPLGARGYLIEYDSRSSEAPALLSMLKRYVLRSKVKLRDVSEEYDVWAAWGSEKEKSWETEREWNVMRSGAVEPVWDRVSEWAWGTEAGVLRDRRAVGMGHRMLVRKGDRPQDASTHDVASPKDYLLHRILQGVPEGITDIHPTHAFPMDSNLDMMGGLDFRKGCYVGQELTVRTYHTGTLRKRIFPVVIHPASESASVLTSREFPLKLEIRARVSQSPDDSVPRTRPRGSGRLLSNTQGVGLALLRLEHIRAVQNGAASFEFETGEDEKTTWKVAHWWPDWWPRADMEEKH